LVIKRQAASKKGALAQRLFRFEPQRLCRAALRRKWQERYGRASSGGPPVMRMPLAEAMALLSVPANFSKEDVLAAFRREAKKAQPPSPVGGKGANRARLLDMDQPWALRA
jgi:hypothetical protein